MSLSTNDIMERTSASLWFSGGADPDQEPLGSGGVDGRLERQVSHGALRFWSIILSCGFTVVSSKEWGGVRAEEKRRLDCCAEDGEFWISYHDFLSLFSRLDICNLTPDTLTSNEVGRWNFAEFEGTWRVGSIAGGCRNYPAIFFIQLDDVDDDPHNGEEGCTILIGLMQKDARRERRFGRDLNTIGFAIYEVQTHPALS
ncbi:calpain-2 catalytic subunit-like [Haplochromis burtoni]|uniref:calpain-2 catalytic subunit-like n=1 Tax=Haplochromis burtoni TaxID=8153 RepID=UPI001C2D7C99|nr:calpain-2 catalytic subunit-like [Haplochromis burtoni]